MAVALFVHKYLLARVASTIAGISILVANWWLWGYWPSNMASLPASLVYRALIYGFQVYVCTFLGFMIAESVSRFWWNRWKPVATSAVKSSRVEIKASGNVIGGILHEPLHLAGPATHGFIIASHGINDNQARAWHWAQGMAAAGFTVFTWDYRGRGGRKGRVTDMKGHVQDLTSIIDHWHQRLEGRNPGGIFLAGWSLGGMVSILAGTENSRVVKVFAWSTWSHLGSVLWRIYANPITLIRYAIKGQLAVMGSEERKRVSPASYLKELEGRIGEEKFQKTVPRKLFLCHAADDRLVPVGNFHENCTIARLPERNRVLFARGSHLMLRREPEVLGLMHRFFTRRE